MIPFFIFVLGAIFGSFLSAVVYRVRLEESFVKGRSRCPNCNHTLAALDLFPIVSWILLGTLSYLVFSLWMVGIYSRGTYHFLFTEQYNIANIFSNIASLKGVIRIQKKFGVSIKTKRRVENTYISAVLFIFLLILGVFEVGGFIHGYLFYHRNIAFLWERSIGLALFWNIYNMGMIGSFLLFVTRHHKKKAQSLQKSPQIATLPAAFSSFRVEQA
jgi:prepilin signal peptidase PulO-like enzyme (type II secretory pathway)